MNSGYTYDAAGNLTGDGSLTYFYDAENRLIQVCGPGGSCSTVTASYTYDAEGRRVERTTGGVTTYYAYDTAGRVAAEVAGSNWTNGYVYFNGQLRAIYDNIANTTRFVHQDHLGSTRLLTNMSGCVVDNLDYLPFGELLANSPACTAADNAAKFTGYERDSESGLDNAQARYYSSAQGRFTSPDPLAGDIGDPQSLNRYAYVRNNPLTLTDPTGMDPCIDGAGCGGCDFCFDFSYLWNPPPPPPPVYNPPNTGAEPNPPSGDPDPNGPFSGPIWQEGGPQIPTTGSLAALLGLQMPSPFIIDNYTQDANGNWVGSKDWEQLCGVYSVCVYWDPVIKTWVSGPPSSRTPRVAKTIARTSINMACGSSPSEAVLEGMEIKFLIGLGEGAWSGMLSGAAASGFLGGIGAGPGAAVGALFGGVIGAGAGVISGAIEAQACHAAGVY